MKPMSDATLGLSRVLLKVGRVLNLVAAVGFFALLVASVVFEDAFIQYYRTNMPQADVARLIPTLRAMVVVGAPMFALVHVLLGNLLQMIDTVRLGDPFVPENAARLRVAAWCMLFIELLHMAFGVLAQQVENAHVEMDWDVSLAGWLAVVLTFVLARIFEEGARLRGDLQAMI